MWASMGLSEGFLAPACESRMQAQILVPKASAERLVVMCKMTIGAWSTWNGISEVCPL